MLAGLRSSTAKSYSSIQKSFLTFCRSLDLVAVPAEQETLLLYVSHLHRLGIGAGSLKVHLAAIRNINIINGYAPLDNSDPRLKLAIKAIQDSQPPPSQKLPLTFNKLKCLWPRVQKDNNRLMWQAALSLAFFGGLRSSILINLSFNKFS